MTNVDLTAERLAPNGGISQGELLLGFIDSGAKAAQNDTWTVTNAAKVIAAWPTVDATGAAGTYTVSTNIITLTSATTGAHSALVLFQPV